MKGTVKCHLKTALKLNISKFTQVLVTRLTNISTNNLDLHK